MKIHKIILFAALMTVSGIVKAQDRLPETFNYQAVVNDEEGKPVAGENVTVEVTIYQESTVKYQELHSVKTSELGLFSVEIGTGTPIAGQFSGIDWLDVSGGYYYLQVRADFGKSEFLNGMNDLGKTKFLTVPYAIAAQNAKTANAAVNAETAETAKMAKMAEAAKTAETAKTADEAKTAEKATDVKLSELTDVNVSEASDGQVLTLEDGKWVAKTITQETASGVDKLTLLTDVRVNNPADGQILKYDATSKTWKNAAEGNMWKKATKGIYTLNNVGIGADCQEPANLLELGVKSGTKTIFDGANLRMTNGSLYFGNTSISGPQTSDGLYSGFAIASYARAYQHSIAFGVENELSETRADGSIAFGASCTTESKYSAAIGNYCSTGQAAYGQLVCGKYNIVMNGTNNAVPAMFVVGNGTASERSNAFYVLSDGNATLSGQLNNLSDSRLKTNAAQINSALGKVEKLRGVTFNWDLSKKPSADRKLQYGFIAQEVEKVFPELVTTDSEGFKSMNYIGIIPVLTEAVKELKKENDELKSTLEDLMKRIEALEKK